MAKSYIFEMCFYQENWYRRLIFFIIEMFLVPPLPKTGQSGAADVAVVPGWHTTVVALRHRIVPPAATCSVVAQSGGEVLLLYSSWCQQRGTGQQAREKWAGERETASPLCWPPALLAPGGNASRPTLGCPPSVAQISTNGKSFIKPTRCKEETIQFIVTFF